MSASDPDDHPPRMRGDRSNKPEHSHGEQGHRGHSRWLMIACCIPMLAIAVALVAAGGGGGFLIIAIVCTVMMAMMMLGMSHGGDDDRRP